MNRRGQGYAKDGNMQSTRRELTNSIGLLIIRLGVGGFMASHGWGKLQMVLAGEFDKFGADPIGVGPTLSLILAIFAEFFCALLVMIGLGTRFAALTVAFAMSVAAFVIHSADPWTMGAGASKEPALLFAIPFLGLMFTGAGKFSLDALIWRAIKGRREGALQAPGSA
jgi:putative oxidoreductase